MHCRYGSRALELLRRYYEGDLADFAGDAADSDVDGSEDAGGASPGTRMKPSAKGASNGARGGSAAQAGGAEAKPLQEEVIAPRGGLPPLLVSRQSHSLGS